MRLQVSAVRKRAETKHKKCHDKKSHDIFITQFHNQITSDVACEKMIFLVKNFEKLKQKE